MMFEVWTQLLVILTDLLTPGDNVYSHDLITLSYCRDLPLAWVGLIL